MYERDNPARSRGYAFVTFQNPADAQTARDRMHNMELDGRRCPGPRALLVTQS